MPNLPLDHENLGHLQPQSASTEKSKLADSLLMTRDRIGVQVGSVNSRSNQFIKLDWIGLV